MKRMLTPAALAAQAGVIDPNPLSGGMARLAPGHRLHRLMVDRTCGRIARPGVAIERQCPPSRKG